MTPAERTAKWRSRKLNGLVTVRPTRTPEAVRLANCAKAARWRLKTRGPAKHPRGTHTAPSSTHPIEFCAYRSAKNRCNNSNATKWRDYGGRGIKFLFTSFEQFFAELGPRPDGKSLDRFPNNDGHYEPGNVRWATPTEQAANKRTADLLRNRTDEELLAELKRRGVTVSGYNETRV